jgi:hypothetical protein
MTARNGVSPSRLAIGFIQPLAACAVMGAAVWTVDHALGEAPPALELPVMIVTGAVAYVGAALVICRAAARNLLQLVNQALRRQPASI